MEADFDIASYYYELPAEQIAQFPVQERDQSRLLVLNLKNDTLQDKNFTDILSFFKPGDLLVVNDTRVFPARFEGRKLTGGKVEMFLLEYPDFKKAELIHENSAQILQRQLKSVNVPVLLKSSKRPKAGSRLFFNPFMEAELISFSPDGKAVARLLFDVTNGTSPEDILQKKA